MKNGSDLLVGQRRMFAWIDALPSQLDESAHFQGVGDVKPLAARPERILCCGMGGSSVAAGLLADGWPELHLPLIVWREHGLPLWADDRTLVIVSSYSGNTAETLNAANEALSRGCPMAAISSGGHLYQMASGSFPAIKLPGGQPPRTALGASLGALLHLLHRLGLLPDPSPSISRAAAHLLDGNLARLPDGNTAEGEAARALAKELAGRFPVIYTAGLAAHCAGRRMLAQLNENAKAAGHHACFPELTHNEIVGWNVGAADRDRHVLVVLRGRNLSRIEARAVDATVELLADQFATVHQFMADGPDHLASVLGLIMFGDLVSAHLAVETGVDPVPIARIDALKARLA